MKESFSEGLEIRAKKEPAAHAFYHVLWIEAKAKVDKNSFKVHIFWEGHKILRNLPLTFDCNYIGQKQGEDFAKSWGLLRIYEFY